MQKKYILLLLFSIFLYPFVLFGQVSEAKIKLQYIYRFAQNIEWSKTTLKDTFKIAYLGDDENFKKYLKLIEYRKVNNYPVKTYNYSKSSKINYSELHLLYIDNNYNDYLPQIFNTIKNKKGILLVSDNYAKQKNVMLNFLTNRDKTITFEVNKKTILDQDLKIKPKLLLLGGKEIDIRELYKKQEKELDKEKKYVEQQKKEIEKLNKSIEEKQKKLIDKEKVLKEKVAELSLQTEKLRKQQVIFEEVKKEVKESKNTLQEKVFALKEKENEILKQNSVIAEQTEKVKKAKKELDEVNQEIQIKKKELKRKENEIAQKQKQLKKRDLTINSQKQWIIIGSIVLFIILVLSILLVKLVRDKNLANAALKYKNIEINNKNSEINSQKEELQSQKEYIEQQYKETQASINYAQTIQATILPSPKRLNSLLNTFTLYRPKDIVSGDFYWHAILPAKGNLTEKHFFAAVDCTGHGVPGAFMSMIGSRLLNEIVNEKKVTNTAQILDMLNEGITTSLKQKTSENRDGMDLCLCRIELTEDNRKAVSFSGAKLPLFVYESKSDNIKVIKGNRKSIGGAVHRKSNDKRFDRNKFIANSGDILYLTTDGYIDQNNQDRKRFGTKKFTKTIQTIAKETLLKQKQILENELDKHQVNTEQRDDITVIGIKL